MPVSSALREESGAVGAAAVTEERGLGPAVTRLLQAAGGLTGLKLLLLLGHDPMTCDTAVGFARRLSQPVSDVREALRSLRESGVLQSCGSLGDTDHPSYWLSEDSTLFSALGELLEAYSASPDRRRGLLRAIRYCPAGTP